jgi:hypothetical protein
MTGLLYENRRVTMPPNGPIAQGRNRCLYVMDKFVFRVANIECHDASALGMRVTHIRHWHKVENPLFASVG